MLSENYRNPSREAKHQQKLLKDYFNHVGDIGWAGGQDVRCVSQQPWGQKLASISPFQDYSWSSSGLPNYSKNFYSKLVSLKFPNKIQSISNKFQTISNQINSPLLKIFNPSYVKVKILPQNVRPSLKSKVVLFFF